MSKREEVTLIASQWQRVLETALHGRANFPKKWGDDPVSIDEQLTGREDLGELFKAIRAYSPWLQEIGDDYRALFGEKSNWHRIDGTGKRIEKADPREGGITMKMTDPMLSCTLRVPREALSGIVWCCILRLHIHCVIPTTTKEAVDTWWPIAEGIGKSVVIRKYIGLAAAKRVEWEDDPEPESDKKD